MFCFIEINKRKKEMNRAMTPMMLVKMVKVVVKLSMD